MWYLPGTSIGISEGVYSTITEIAIIIYILSFILLIFQIKKAHRGGKLKELLGFRLVVILVICFILAMIQMIYYEPYNTNMKINEIESISIGFESFSDYSYKFEEDNIRHLLLDKINSLEFRRTTGKDASVFLNEDVVFLHFMYFDNQDIHYMQLLVDEENIIMFDSFTHIKSYSIGDDYEEFNEFIELFREIGITEDIGL